MRVVFDTNVVISAVFFGGHPLRALETVVKGEIQAWATQKIIDEYESIIEEMIARQQGRLRKDIAELFINKIYKTESREDVHVCRDSDDDKFLSCAMDCKAIYVVSGDKDLLSIGKYEGIEIITAKELLARMP